MRTDYSIYWSLPVYCALFVPTVFIAGCSDDSKLSKVPLTGSVTLDGNPIPNGEILFYPLEGTRGSVSGGAIKDGKYIADGRGGVPLGAHKVEIRAFRAPKSPSSAAALEGGPAEQYLPRKFNIDSELKAEVNSSSETLDFNLQSS